MVEQTGPGDERDDRQAVRAVLDVIERIAADHPTETGDVAAMLGVDLLRAGGSSTELYDVFDAEPAGRFARAEWRTPASPRATGGRRLILELAPQGCIDPAALTDRFGSDIADLRVPSPSGLESSARVSPSEVLVHYVYRRAWGTLSFGFRREPPECLRAVTFTIEQDTE